MQIHNIVRKNKNKKSVQVGRGGTRGKTAGRGTKGQKARAGRKLRPEMRDIIKKLPKLRGRGKNSFKSFAPIVKAINLDTLEHIFSAGDIVSPKTLSDIGAVRIVSGVTPKVKILSKGEITKKLTIEGCAVSVSAKAKIEKVGGEVK